ncbi:MAG: aminotransferase class V-fold PLP-dependent enzyme, partial [Gemmatimonadaceae bacterium]
VSTLAGAAAAPAILPSFSSSAFRRLAEANAIAKSSTTPFAFGESAGRSAESLASDEDFWEPIQRAFEVDRSYINLNNGGVSPTPTHVMEQMFRDLHFSNEMPTIHMWQTLDPRIESARRELAIEFGCDTEEMAIVRNASEAMETLIFGFDLKAGDEVIVSNQNYPRMLTSWRQRARREGIIVKDVSFPLAPSNMQNIVDKFAAAITPRTRVMEFPHITNLSGQILPVHDIIAMARARNVEVFIDGAHAFAHFPFKRDDLGVDFYGTSLHKGLMAPVGTGFLYVRKEKQEKIWPRMGADPELNANIRKYEQFGTHPSANFNAISTAIAFHRGIGAERKIARLRFLRDRWAKRLLKEGGGRVKILTPLDSEWGGGICMFNVDGIDPVKLGGWMMGNYRIISTPTVHPEFKGIRIVPNVYTTLAEVDRFSEVVLKAIKSGIA